MRDLGFWRRSTPAGRVRRATLVGVWVLGVSLSARSEDASPAAETTSVDRGAIYARALTPVPATSCEIDSWDSAFREAESRSNDLRIALGSVRVAEGGVRIALGQLLPQASGTASLGSSGVRSTSSSGFNLGVVASQSLVDLAAWQSLDASRTEATSFRLAHDDVRRQIALSLSNAIFGVLTAERLTHINRQSLEQSIERLRLAKRRLELGGGTAIDVARAQQDAELALALVVSGDEALRRAREALGLAIGRPEQCSVASTLRIESLESLGRTCVAGELLDRADLASRRAAVDAATQRQRAVVFGFIPSARLDASVTTTAGFTGSDASFSAWSIQGVINIPIWDGGVRYGAMRQTAGQRTIAEEQLEALRREATIDVARARRAIDVATAALDASRASRDDVREVERLARASFQQGLTESLDLMTAAAQLRAAEIDYAIRELQLVSARMFAVLIVSRCS